MIENVGIPSIVLMENAARGIADELSEFSSVLILCGSGNNGGDGIALLRQLAMRNIKAKCVILSNEERLSRDSLINYKICVNTGLDISFVCDLKELENVFEEKYDALVDAMFGIGLSRPVDGIYKTAIELSNAYNSYKVAVDIASGINSNNGIVMSNGEDVPCAFKADKTVTMQHLKRGHILNDGRDYSGKVVINKIGVCDKYFENIIDNDYNEKLVEYADVKKLLPERKINSHKGTYGRALLIAGSENLYGAAVMAARSALKSGAGLLSVVCPQSIKSAFYSLPEAMIYDVDRFDFDKLDRFDAIGCGCGMGRGDSVRDIVNKVIESGKPCVIDADGINALAVGGFERLNENVILTPHPMEMSRLCGEAVGDILSSPVECAVKYAKMWECNIILKGATSIIADKNGAVRYNTSGNPALAKGGSGDTLTGIILALLAQKIKPFEAAYVGAYLLGSSADETVRLLSNRMINASDVQDNIDFMKF